MSLHACDGSLLMDTYSQPIAQGICLLPPEKVSVFLYMLSRHRFPPMKYICSKSALDFFFSRQWSELEPMSLTRLLQTTPSMDEFRELKQTHVSLEI